MNKISKIDENLRKIKDEVLECRKCSLYKTRTFPVIGQGNHYTKIMFIGEAPGYNEDKTGRPFCGQAGGILDELLNSAQIKRQEIYICNILKCRPPSNRNPQKEEIEACAPYLERQIEIIKPKIICSMGNYAATYILEKFGLKDKIQGISKIRGMVFEASASFGLLKIVPFYHPAVVVYNQNMKKELEKDFQVLKNL